MSYGGSGEAAGSGGQAGTSDENNKPSSSGTGSGGRLPDGIERFKLFPENNGQFDVFGFRLAGNRTMGCYVTSVIGGSLTEKVKLHMRLGQLRQLLRRR